MSNQATRLAEEAKRATAKLHDAAMTVAAGQKPLTNLASMQRCWFDADAAIDALLALVQPAVNEEAERAAFEAWEHGRGGNVTRHDSGVYANSTMQGRWTVWLARAQSSADGKESPENAPR